jgi:malic enzyme
MGLTQAKPNASTLSWANPAFGAGVAAIAVAVALELYKSFNIEEVAISAIAARDAFGLIEEDVDLALQSEDPMPQLNAVTEESKTLLRNFHKVIPKIDIGLSAKARAMADSLIDKNKPYWRLPTP